MEKKTVLLLLIIFGVLPILALTSSIVYVQLDMLSTNCVIWDADQITIDRENPNSLQGEGACDQDQIPVVVFERDETRSEFMLNLTRLTGGIFIGVILGFAGALMRKRWMIFVSIIFLLISIFPFHPNLLEFLTFYTIGMMMLVWREREPTKAPIAAAKMFGTLALLGFAYIAITEILEQFILDGFYNLIIMDTLHISVLIGLLVMGLYSWLSTPQASSASES